MIESIGETALLVMRFTWRLGRRLGRRLGGGESIGGCWGVGRGLGGGRGLEAVGCVVGGFGLSLGSGLDV